MRILVIGGTGFIGPHIVRQLAAEGYEVGVFHRGLSGADLPGGIEELRGDRHDLEAHRTALLRFAPEVVIDVILSSGTQARALRRVFDGVARRVVALSSMDVYRSTAVYHGLEPGPLEPIPLREDSALRRQHHTYPPEILQRVKQLLAWVDDDYEKIEVEREILQNDRGTGDAPERVVLRLPQVYGPGDRLRRFGPLLVQMQAGAPSIPFTEEMAAWRTTRGFVGDIAAAVALAATAAAVPSRIYNVGEPDALSELEWARLIGPIVGWTGEFVVVPAAEVPELRVPGNFAQHWVADTSLIRRELGFRERWRREEALQETFHNSRAVPR